MRKSEKKNYNKIINYKKIESYLEKSSLFMKLYAQYNDIALSIGSIYFGAQLLLTPIIVSNFENHGTFGYIMKHFEAKAYMFGVFLLIISMIKIKTILNKSYKINKICNVLFFSIYCMIFFSFLLATPPNMITTFSLIMTLFSFGLILKERN